MLSQFSLTIMQIRLLLSNRSTHRFRSISEITRKKKENFLMILYYDNRKIYSFQVEQKGVLKYFSRVKISNQSKNIFYLPYWKFVARLYVQSCDGFEVNCFSSPLFQHRVFFFFLFFLFDFCTSLFLWDAINIVSFFFSFVSFN